MVTSEQITEALRTIPDPEMPISIVDLGLVEAVCIEPSGQNGSSVRVDILPTFVGCPALDMIRRDIEAKVARLDGVSAVEVRFVYDPPWSVDRITAEGRTALRAHGVTVPPEGSRLDVPAHQGTVQLRSSAVPCPFCGSRSTYLDSPFGPTRCRAIHYCESCGNSFEHMKRV